MSSCSLWQRSLNVYIMGPAAPAEVPNLKLIFVRFHIKRKQHLEIYIRESCPCMLCVVNRTTRKLAYSTVVHTHQFYHFFRCDLFKYYTYDSKINNY